MWGLKHWVAQAGKFACRVAAGQSPAARDEAAAIDTDGEIAHRVVEQAALFRAVNIARIFSFAQTAIKFLRRLEASPFIRKGDVALPGDPPAALVAQRTKFRVGRIHADARRIDAMKRIRRSRHPFMEDITFRDAQRL